ncbi:MAG TPA: B-box zinc finger protein [Acidobacteriaceae bacterium]|nr:B-box zinc finger protein [Acidobacteriaceae bacterium]
MNCVNHPEAAVTAFCQNCGKGLCAQCSREVQGNVFCEPCLAARVAGGAAAGPGPAGPGPVGPGGAGPYVPPPVSAPNPGTATILGFIPGVGAMYNGQYIKAIVHVLVFVVLISITEHYGIFGIFVGAWVLYQVFDAHQTAKARRDGLPLPDPFGLNELGNAFGGHTPPRYTPPVAPPPPGAGTAGVGGVPPGAPGAMPGNPAQPYADWAEQVRQQAHEFGRQSAEWGEQLRQRIVSETQRPFTPGVGGPGTWGAPPPPPGFVPPQGFGPPPGFVGTPGAVPPGVVPPGAVPPGAGYVPPQPPPGWAPPVPPDMELERARREPIGAIVLILLGMLFLFNTLGFFNFGWVHHGWPLIIVGIAVWLLLRNTYFGGVPRVGPPPPPPPVGGMGNPAAHGSGTTGTAASSAAQEPPAGGAQ